MKLYKILNSSGKLTFTYTSVTLTFKTDTHLGSKVDLHYFRYMTKTMLWEACLGILLMTVDFTACQDIDIFFFSEQWPAATCIKGQQEGKTCITPLVHTYWTIHGLWPSSSSGISPSYCPGPNFNRSEISSLMEELISYWPDIYDKTSLHGLWCHEWERHGTCARNISDTKNEFRYFKKNLELIKRFNITSILSKHSAPPRDVKPYTPTHIVNILKKQLGHAPLLVCFEDKENKRSLLLEVRICLDLRFKVIDCPKFATNGTLFENVYEHAQNATFCGKKFYYIPL